MRGNHDGVWPSLPPEPEPSLETAKRGAAFLLQFQPDWILALGGGSVIDAAKAMWVLYERPDLTPDAINPIEPLGLGAKARLCAIPTTTGTGSEATWAIVLTDPAERRKLGLGSREALPDLAILDPETRRRVAGLLRGRAAELLHLRCCLSHHL